MAGNKKQINFEPTPGHVFVEPLVAEEKTDSGIYLPEASKEKPQIGKVIAVGEDEILTNGEKRKSPAKKGDKVIYKKWGGNEIKIGQDEYLFVKFEDILAVGK